MKRFKPSLACFLVVLGQLCLIGELEINCSVEFSMHVGGVLTIVMNGEKNVESVHIDPSIIDPEDAEMLEDLMVAAVNEASKKVDDMMAQEMSKITGGMNLPGMF